MTTILSALVLLGILIFVHELGHFLFAKLVKVKVLKFSLGFGPKLIGTKRGDTEYLISTIPLGGYVKMLGEDSEGEIAEEDRARAYNFQPVWKRFLIVSSGPVFNIIFAIVVFILLLLLGIPVPYPEVGKIINDSPASRAGLMTGDRVLEINGKTIQSWDDVLENVDQSSGRPLLFKVRRDNSVTEITITPERRIAKDILGDKTEIFDIGTSYLVRPVIGEVNSGSPADKAGLNRGDRILEVEGKGLKTWEDMTDIIHNSPGKSLMIRVERDNHTKDLAITPNKETVTLPTGEKKEIGLIGIKPLANDFKKRFGLGRAISLGIQKTWEMTRLLFIVLEKIVQRSIRPSDALGGPIIIMQMAGQQASLGLANFLSFLAAMSVNLGIINLFPIPILDGGHLMFLTLEGIRRKPLNEKVMAIAQRVGLTILITLIVFVLYNDFMKVVLPWLQKRL